jgi:hypothetical protein
MTQYQTANIAETNVVPVGSVGSPYYDDYNEDNYYHRILFRPGYAVQARELTQMQTIAQNQVERFGRSIYENGSIVSGGQISLDYARTINLQPQFAGSDVNVSSFIGKMIAYGSTNTSVQAVVIGGSSNTSFEPPSLTIKYLTGNEFGAGDTIMVPNTTAFATIASSNPFANATVAFINDGVFFFNGYFVKSPGQKLVVDKYSRSANARIGMEISDAIITETSDASLLDPALESSNYQAPGASRYQIILTLSRRSLTSTDDSKFSELLRIENGDVKKKVIYPEYSVLEDTFARRTFDESGSYTVRPFKISVTDSRTGNSNTYTATLDPGKAYVFGYEFETIAQTPIEIPRARTTSTVLNYNLNTTFGNFLFVKDARGFLDHSAAQIVDLHCVPHQQVSNVASPSTTPTGAHYRSTKIGTSRVRMLTYDSAANTSNQATYVYKMYLFDTQFSNLSSNIQSFVAANQITLFDPSGANVFSSLSGAYDGATIRLISGPGSPQQSTILNYNVAANGLKTIFSTTPFVTAIATPNTQTKISIEFDPKDIESIVVVDPATGNTGLSNTWTKYNASDANKVAGSTYFQESTDPSLLFPLPQQFIKEGSMTLSSKFPKYFYRKVFSSVSFSGGQATITIPSQPNENFAVSVGSNIPGTSTSILNNFLVVVDSPSTSGRSKGDIVTLSSVDVTTTAQATLKTGITENFTATVIATVRIVGDQEGSPKSKQKVFANTTNFVGGSSNGSFIRTYTEPTTEFTSSSNTTVYLNAGQILIQSPFKTPGVQQSLYISDVIAIKKIYDLAGAAVPSPGASISGLADVTSKFNFDNGQRDTHYAHASISLKSSTLPPTGNLIVCVDWFDHLTTTTSVGYFNVDSYTSANVSYAETPSYKFGDGTDINLRDCIDFRPRVQNAQNTFPNYAYQGLRLSIPTDSVTLPEYAYYLGRKDKLVLTKDRKFKLIQGVPSVNPQEPGDITDSMVLYKLYSPPYTLYPANVSISYVENRRYTMRDIGALAARISNLEYYTTLSLLEKNATDIAITDDLGLARAKYGVIVDSFTGHSIGDVTNPDYDCSMDIVTGGMTARNLAKQSKLAYATNSGASIESQMALMSYTEETFVSQSFATKTVNLQPYMFATYAGTISMSPDADIWIDTVTAPAVIINPSGQNDNLISVPPSQNNPILGPDPFGGRTNWWEIGWFGVEETDSRNFNAF